MVKPFRPAIAIPSDVQLPPPPYTDDVDLHSMPGFMLDTGVMLQSDLWAVSSGEEFKAWMALIMRSWHRVPSGSLPNDDALLQSMTPNPRRWSAVKEVALRGWYVATNGLLYNAKLSTYVGLAAANQQSQRKRASHAATIRYERERAARSILKAQSKHAPSMPQAVLGDANFNYNYNGNHNSAPAGRLSTPGWEQKERGGCSRVSDPAREEDDHLPQPAPPAETPGKVPPQSDLDRAEADLRTRTRMARVDPIMDTFRELGCINADKKPLEWVGMANRMRALGMTDPQIRAGCQTLPATKRWVQECEESCLSLRKAIIAENQLRADMPHLFEHHPPAGPVVSVAQKPTSPEYLAIVAACAMEDLS